MPISIQTFKKIREQNYIYVDKTALIYELTRKEGSYFTDITQSKNLEK
ncbi:MAG: AAA family ATPase [Saprospiraceae bacterium]|nr:AAA family ATPase [Saprospiraceae bacterium]